MHLLTVLRYVTTLTCWMQASQDMDLSTKLPADPAAGRSVAQLVVGSLDLNIGAVLPAEELVGRLPAEDARTRRAYLSNVCVAKAARRQGIAQTLMAHAEREAAAAGVTHLYVHVVSPLQAVAGTFTEQCTPLKFVQQLSPPGP